VRLVCSGHFVPSMLSESCRGLSSQSSSSMTAVRKKIGSCTSGGQASVAATCTSCVQTRSSIHLCHLQIDWSPESGAQFVGCVSQLAWLSCQTAPWSVPWNCPSPTLPVLPPFGATVTAHHEHQTSSQQDKPASNHWDAQTPGHRGSLIGT